MYILINMYCSGLIGIFVDIYTYRAHHREVDGLQQEMIQLRSRQSSDELEDVRLRAREADRAHHRYIYIHIYVCICICICLFKL
jgi:hypothetical protein